MDTTGGRVKYEGADVLEPQKLRRLRSRILQYLRPGSSLCGQARREQARLRGIGFVRRLGIHIKVAILAIFTRPFLSFVALLIIGAAGLLLPSKVPLCLWQPRFDLFG